MDPTEAPQPTVAPNPDVAPPPAPAGAVSRPVAGPPDPRLLLWPLTGLLVLASGCGSLLLLTATFDSGEPALVLGIFAPGFAVLAGTVGFAAGGLLARLEARTRPLLPARSGWLRLGVARGLWAGLAGGLLWAPAHVLGLLAGPGYRSDDHLAAAVLGLLFVGPWVACVLVDRRERRALAARTPAGVESVTALDRVPSLAWQALLIGALTAIPTGLLAASVLGEADMIVLVTIAVSTIGAACGGVALAARLGPFGAIGDREGAVPRAVAALAGGWGPAWAMPYLVALLGGSWLVGSGASHSGRLLLGVISATALLACVAAVAWSRAPRAPAAAR